METSLRYRLIVSDLDGTLLNDYGEISNNTVRRVADFHESGGLFTIATGRLDESARVFAEQLGVKIPIITYNGARITDFVNGGVLREGFLDNSLAKETYLALRAFDIDVIVYSGQNRYAAAKTPVIDKYILRIRKDVDIVGNIDDVINDEACLEKMLVIYPRSDDELIFSLLRPIFKERLNCYKSDDDYYEVMPPDITKGSALKTLTRTLNIPLSNTIAIGDHLNDLDMIRTAGLGVAVANAVDEVIMAADYLTTSNNRDGVARVVMKALENKL